MRDGNADCGGCAVCVCVCVRCSQGAGGTVCVEGGGSGDGGGREGGSAGPGCTGSGDCGAGFVLRAVLCDGGWPGGACGR